MKPLETLYRSLLKNNYDVPDSYESFERTLTAPGSEGVKNRQQLHRALVANNYDVPEDYSRFSRTLFAPVKPKAAAPKPQQTPAGGAAFGLPEGMAYSDEVERRHNSPSNVAGSYKDRAQIASEVQSEGLPAYRQGSKKPVQRDASSYGIPYRPDIELTAAQRDEIEQQNGYAAKQVKQMRQQSEKNQRRRNQPVIDTGDENVNRHIIKTQGQWEDELMNGVNDLGRKYVSPMIEKALKKADNDFFGVFEQASRYPQMQGMELAALRRANERVDPDKILQGLQKSLEKTYSNPEMLKDIEERANAAGIPKDEYLKQVVIPSLQDQLVSEFTNSQIAKHMPKNATEYILQGMSNSIGGMLMGAATETEAQRRYKNEAAAMTEEGLNPHYTPGTGAKLAQMGVSFAADAPFFGFYGKVGGNVAKGLAERQIRKLTAKGLSEGAARSIVGTALENSVGQRMKNYIMQHVVSSSITMGGYNATSETARQVRDREFKPGQIIGSTAEGLATGAAFGLTGGAVQALSQPLSGIARIGSKVGGYLVEGETMYTTEELAKMVHGEEGFTNPFEGSAEAMMKLGVMKVSSPGGLSKAAGELFHPIKSNRRQQTGVRFTPEEEAYVRESAEGKSLLDALSQMHPEVATTEVKGKRLLTAEGEQMRQQLAERYNAFMGNTEIPYAVKAKVAGALGGLMPDAAHTPLETGADIIHNADGSVILKTRDKDGNCMQEFKFDSFSEADNWREEHEGDFRLNDAVNMWNSASPEARANTIKQLMEEYGIGEEEAATMIKSALGGNMGKDFSNDQLLYVYNTVRDNAYPADEPNTRRNYWEGQKLTPQERHQAMVEAQQAEDRLTYMDQAFADEIIGAADFPDEKIAELAGRDEITGEQLQAAIDYYNKAARFNGMMEKTAQSVDEQVEAANAFIRRNTHTDSGNVVEVELDGKGYYLTAGKLALNQDGSLDLNECGEVMILRDKDTGEIQVVKPSKLHITALSDPKLMIADNESMDGLRGRLMQEANNSITLADGTPEAPQNGDYFTGADGIRYMAIGVPDEQGNVVWSKIALDEKGEPVGEPKDLDIDEYRKAKSDEIDRDSQTIPEEEIVSDIPETVNHEGEIIPVEAAEQPLPQQEEKTPVVEEATVPDAEKGSSSSQTAFPRIPVVNGKTDWESASTEDSRAALTERYGEEKAREMVGRMIANLKQSYDELLKKDVSKMTDMDKLAAYEDELADIKRKMEYWQQVFEERPALEVVPEEKPAAEQPQSVPELTDNVPKLTESVPETPESVPSEQQPVIPQEPTPPAEKPAEPQPPVQPQKPTAEQKIAEGSVKANLGKTFELRHSDGRRTEMRLESISPGGRAVVTQTDYDAQGNRIGEPQRKVYNVTDIGGSIIQGAMKPVLSTEEKLRAAFKGRVGILNVIDVLTDSEQEQTESHREDIILNERDKRNANVSQIMEGSGSREDKLRRVRKQYQGYDDAVLALSDEAMQPTTLEEYVADLHSRVPKSGEGPIAYFSYDRDGTKVVGMQDETGHGTKTGGDTKGYAPWLAPKGKGVSLAKYAEQLHEQLPEGIKAQYSDQDVHNAILEVFGGAERPSDITTMVIKRGIIQAEQAARRMEEMWIEGGPSFHRVSIDDNTFAGRLARGKQQTNTEPTEKQKEAGNYKKGHVSFGGYDFVIENPEGSMRRGKDADGNTWEQQMHNTYGYILGKKGKDGDHLDMFINDQADLDTWNGNVYVVDQVNADGSFDEHKIMYGFNSEAEAREAYLSNYSEGWKGLGRITGVDKDTFDKWLDSSDRKIKEFAEHSIIKDAVKPVETEPHAKAPTPAERDKVLMDTVVDKMKEAGIDVSTDWEEGQRVIDEYNGSRELKPMGTTVKDKMAAFRDEILNHQMDDEQSRIVSVFTGDADHQVLEFQREDGSSVKAEFQQGNDTGVGTKHSLYGHYGTTRGVIEAGDTLLIPDIMRTGERKVNGNRVTYTKKIGAKRFTVLFDRKGNREVFDDFFSSWKIKKKKDPIVGRSSTEGDTPAGVRNRDTDTFSGARSLNTDDSSGAKVQQNPETTKESDEKLKQFKTSDGHAYGFTYKGKIYIDPRIATSETPIHEYGHLWAEMKRQTAPEEWDAIKNVLLNDKLVKPIIDRVKKDYPELAKEGREDDFIEEILTQFSGKRGAERLREIAEQIAAEKGGVFGKAEAVTAMQRLKNILNQFWAGVARMMGWKYRNANDIADRMMLDMLEGVNPRVRMKETSSQVKSQQEIERTLMGVHNLSEDKLRKVIKAGGLANPSLAVVDTKQGIHTQYGDISLIPKASLIDKRTGRNAGTFAGDAWTPTYPHVERMLTKQGEKRAAEIAKEVAGDDEETARHIRSRINDYFEGNGDRMHFLFLKQKGLDPQIRKERIAHSQEEYDAITKIFGEPTSNMPNRESITKEQNDALVDLMVSVYEKKLREGIDPEKPLTEKMQNYLDTRVEKYRKNLLDDDGYIWFAQGYNFIYDNWRDEKRRQNPQPDWYGTDNDASYQVAKEGLSEEYEKWKESLLTDDEVEEKLFAGYTPSGNRRYLPNTVENASRLMNKNSDQNAYDQGGFGPTRAMLLQNFASLADIRRHKDLIQKDEKVEERTKELSDELFDIINQISDMQKISDNRFSNIDYAEARLQEAMGKKNPIRHLNKEYGYDIPEDGELASQLMNFMDDVRNLPAKYFETKFKRPVTLDEFEIAVVPEDTSEDVVKALKDAGLEVRTFDNTGGEEVKNENRRQAVMDAVQGRDDIMFQKRSKVRYFDKMEAEQKSEVRKRLEGEKALPATENIITKREGVSARNAAMEWANENIPEAKTVSTEIGDLIINKKSISDSLAHGFSQSKLDAIPTLLPAFEDGHAVYVGSGEDVNGNPITDHYFAYPIDYKGNREYVFCRTREDQNTHRLYIHEVITGEDIKNGQTLQSTAPEKPRTGLPLYRNIMSDVFGSKDTKKSDTFQENGEKSSDEGPKFQRVSPESELTPEERQYWKQWDAAMKKWKERNAIAADVTGPGEQPKINQGENVLDYAKRLVAHKRESALWQTAPKLEDFHQVRDDKAAQDEAHANEKAYPDSESAKRWRVATDLARLRHAMSRQKAYDKATVKAVTDFAQDFMKMGFGDNLGRGKMERLLSSVKNATGAKDIRKQVDNIMNILIDNQLRNLDQQVVKLSSVKELSKTAQGVEKQGRLELKGQRMIQAFREAREGRMDAEKIRERMGVVAEKMARNDDEAPMWEQEYEGMSIALQYQENIEGSRDEWADLDREYKDAMKEYKQSGRSYKAQQELLESLEQAMMENKIERIGMFGDIIGRLQGNISESMQGAKEFVEREKERMKHIQQMANADLDNVSTRSSRKETKTDRLLQNDIVRLVLSPLGTFEQFLKQFGSRDARGVGRLHEYYIRGFIDAQNNAYTGEVKAREEMDAKAREIFGGKVKHWSDLYDISRQPGIDVEYIDGGETVKENLSQGNMLYIYMANKMTDGKMKLRAMGITEEQVEQLKEKIDPRLVQLGDWLQSEYLVNKRVEYNKVYERMFGAPMAAIENYFPIKVNRDASYQDAEKYMMSKEGDKLPSNITGSIINRRRNALPLDILHTDALDVAMEHIQDMEHWKAQAEWNRDVKDLLSYTTFRNKVKNMKTIYGSGSQLWNDFFDAATIATGDYVPKRGAADKALTNIAKGITGAKINFRIYTALKQLQSIQAFVTDVPVKDLAKAMMPQNYFYYNFKWAKENIPVFRKRWESRQIGDTRLMDDPTDWKIWKKKWMQEISKYGMYTNAAIDALTCAAGAKATYDSKYMKYKEIGAPDEVARKRALQDAAIAYNLTQQSSEGAFVSAIQKDRTLTANALTVFRNGPFSYTRQAVDALRNLKHLTQKGYKEDSIRFTAQKLRDELGIDEAQAEKAAELQYAHTARHEFVKALNMMFGITITWNLLQSVPYLIFGDDGSHIDAAKDVFKGNFRKAYDEFSGSTKGQMWADAVAKGIAGGPVEGLAAGNIWSDMMGSALSEKTRTTFSEQGLGAAFDEALKQAGDYEVNPLPMMADIQSMIEKMGYDKYAAAQDLFNIIAQSYIGVNPQTFTDAWNAAIDYGNPSWMPLVDNDKHNQNLSNSKEIALFIMRVLNAPTNSWRNKYIDELGMNAEDARKLPYDEMARRYANYKHWKDAPLMGWLRGEEGRQEKMEKIRKQFDKSVQERMERLDDEELRDNLLRSKSLEERRLLAKAVASRFGLAAGEDAKKTREQWQQNYQQLMEYEDIREDALLSDKKKEANARGDKKTVKAINDLQGRIREKGKKKLGGDDDAELMQKIRQWRREALEKAIQAESR